MANLLDVLKDKLSDRSVKVVLPEGKDKRVLTTATQLQATDYATPVVLGDETKVQSLTQGFDLDISNIELINSATSELKAELVQSFVERRKGKVTEERAQELLSNANHFDTMLVYVGKADGLVSGAAYPTGDTIHPALQIIRTRPGVSRTSGISFMIRGDEQHTFDDYAINPELDSRGPAEIAVEGIKPTSNFGMDPKVVVSSSSTGRSIKLDDVARVQKAAKLAQQKAEEEKLKAVINGEFQFDAMVVPGAAEKKTPDARLQDDANVFIFPSLETGDISYKIT